MNKNMKIFVAGHRGLVGSSILKELHHQGFNNTLTKTRNELDLENQLQVSEFFEMEKPECVILAAAKVGGIKANIAQPVEFLYGNLMIQNNVIKSAYKNGVKRLIFLGSSCIYPRLSKQPMKEEYLLDGKLEPTNEGYAIAKIAGLKLCEYYNKEYDTEYIGIMPPNVYGPGDHYYSENSHVISALITKFHEAKKNNDKSVTVWGTGKARREFMYIEELSQAIIFLMQNYRKKDFINVGTGKDATIAELAQLIKETVGFEGTIEFDQTKPDGMPQKLMDVSRLTNEGWKSTISLKEGLKKTYEWFLKNEKDLV